MTKPNLLELAKQGDEEAIISVMNYLLKDKGITAKAAQKDDCLLVVLKSAQVPEQKSSVAFIHKLMMKLKVESIKCVKVYGKETGQQSPAWMEALDLTPKLEEAKKQADPLESLWQGNLKAWDAIASRWTTPRNAPAKSQSARKASGQKPQKSAKKLLIILLIPLIAVGIYLFSKWPELKESIPIPVASQVPLQAPSKTAVVTPSPVTSELPALSPQPDSFREAVNTAMSAAILTQSAKSKDDWNKVASQWQEAIALIKGVPASSPNYAVAQKKVVEYQLNLDYALSAASRAQ
jgi:hypothetical protein